MKRKIKNRNHVCIYCGGIGVLADDSSHTGTRRCTYCNASIVIHGVEIKVQGSNSDEVKEVSQHLFKQAGRLNNRKQKKPRFIQTIKNVFMRFFSRKVKCKRFYEIQSRTIDITGLSTGIPEKFNFGLGSFKLDTKFQEASDQLKTLDILQYGLCNDINGISDPVQKDKLLQKIIETKTRMLEIVLEISAGNNKTAMADQHFNYLTKPDLINLLLHFNSDAFTTPFRLEQSLINYENRINAVYDLISGKLKDIHPDYKKYVLEIFSLLKALRKLSQQFTDRTYYIPWQHDSLAIDIIRYGIVGKVNLLLSALQASDQINSERFLKDSYLVTESIRYPDSNTMKEVEAEAEKVKNFFLTENISTQLLDNYLNDLNKYLPAAGS